MARAMFSGVSGIRSAMGRVTGLPRGRLGAGESLAWGIGLSPLLYKYMTSMPYFPLPSKASRCILATMLEHWFGGGGGC